MDGEAGMIALLVAYDGAPFAGFAAQPGRETVQGRLEGALRTVLGHDVTITCAGRTDAGVHALGQVVSFPAEGAGSDPAFLRRSLNALAGPDIVVREVLRTGPGFSARHSAEAREYRYRIAAGSVPPLFASRFAWWVKDALDLDAMREAGGALVGEHDFTSFCVAESAQEKPTVREVLSVDVAYETELGEELVVVTMTGRSFLHSMVRIVVGSLVEVGRGRQSASWLRTVLETRDRTVAGPTAPPHGLVMWRVGYPSGTFGWIGPDNPCSDPVDTPGGVVDTHLLRGYPE